jgi:hypothetical protein
MATIIIPGIGSAALALLGPTRVGQVTWPPSQWQNRRAKVQTSSESWHTICRPYAHYSHQHTRCTFINVHTNCGDVAHWHSGIRSCQAGRPGPGPSFNLRFSFQVAILFRSSYSPQSLEDWPASTPISVHVASREGRQACGPGRGRTARDLNSRHVSLMAVVWHSHATS